MKKAITLAIAIVMCVSCAFIIPNTNCYAATKAKYIKVKQATYDKMKKTIASQKKTIASQKKTITARNTTISNQKTTIANQKATISDQKLQISDLNATIKDKKSTISWLWNQLEEFGFEYNYDTHQWEGTAEPEEPAEPDWIEPVDMEDATDVIPLLQEQTGLTIDNVQLIDNWKSWYCYYVEADGDLYVITVKNKIVDVMAQLN